MAEINVICDICFEVVAKVDTDKLIYPMTGSMFKSPDPFHGVPDPFEPGALWEYMWCPWSNHTHRISQGPDAIMIEGRAYYRVPTYAEVLSRRNVQAEVRKEPEVEDDGIKEEDLAFNDPGTVNEVKEVTEETKADIIQEAAEEVRNMPPSPYADPTGQEKDAMFEVPRPEKQVVVDDGRTCRICGNTFKTKLACASHTARIHKPGSERELE